MSNIDSILAQTTIEGLDITEALGRMGNSGKLYMRIIHSFITNMPLNLEELQTSDITAETLGDYAIKIHGAKGSCYGIGANTIGDIARTLEMAAKAGDLDTCLQQNDSFIQGTNELLVQLKELEAAIETAQAGEGIAQQDKPDAAKLAALLAATQSFDISQMNTLVEELTSVQYASGNETIAAIKQSFEAFDYQAIEEAITAYL